MSAKQKTTPTPPVEDSVVINEEAGVAELTEVPQMPPSDPEQEQKEQIPPDTEKGDGDDLQYPAAHFLKSNWYSHKRKALEEALDKEKQYSYAQVERLLSKQ